MKYIADCRLTGFFRYSANMSRRRTEKQIPSRQRRYGRTKRLAACAALALCGALPRVAHAGPPFQTDDPEPIEYKHTEMYAFTLVDSTGKNAGGTVLEAPAYEVNYGALPNVHLHLVIPMTTLWQPMGASGTSGSAIWRRASSCALSRKPRTGRRWASFRSSSSRRAAWTRDLASARRGTGCRCGRRRAGARRTASGRATAAAARRCFPAMRMPRDMRTFRLPDGWCRSS